MIDTHSHIYGPEYNLDRDEVLARASASGVTHSVLANVDTISIPELLDCHRTHPDCTSMAMGLHPTSVRDNYLDELRTIEDTLSLHPFVAIGEVGIDLYWDKTYDTRQYDALARQIDWAVTLDLPLILHVRKAYAETFRVLNRFHGHPLRGVFHCFGGGIEEARKAVSMGFYLGIGGVVTYKNSNLSDIIRPIGLEHLLLETDAPYLSPVPNRGKRNEPANLTHVCSHLASVFDTNRENIDEITTRNARNLFRLP